MNLPKNPEEYAFEHLNRSARFARCARRWYAVFPVTSCCFLRFRWSCLKSSKNRPPSFQNHPQNHPKSFKTKKRPRNFQKRPQNPPKSTPKRSKIEVWRWFGRLLGRWCLFRPFFSCFLKPLGGVVAATGRARTRPRRPKTPQDAPKTLQEAYKTRFW